MDEHDKMRRRKRQTRCDEERPRGLVLKRCDPQKQLQKQKEIAESGECEPGLLSCSVNGRALALVTCHRWSDRFFSVRVHRRSPSSTQDALLLSPPVSSCPKACAKQKRADRNAEVVARLAPSSVLFMAAWKKACFCCFSRHQNHNRDYCRLVLSMHAICVDY